MDHDDYKQYLRGIRQKYGSDVGLTWGKAHCQPKIDLIGLPLGWTLLWVGVFSDPHFLRVKEDWAPHGNEVRRGFFSYHYGRYEKGWNLLSVRSKSVIVRIDAMDYKGLGYHLHSGAKDRRIYQADLISPDLSKIGIDEFINSILSLRSGKSVEEAFDLAFR